MVISKKNEISSTNLGATTFSITTLNIKGFFATLSVLTLNIKVLFATLSITTLPLIRLSVTSNLLFYHITI